MYTVTIETIKKAKSQTQTYQLGEFDTEAYDMTMSEISDVLYELEMDFDVIDGDGDMAIDDILIAISEEETFEHRLKGRGVTYIVKGYEA